MKKYITRIICVVLCLCMLTGVLASCGDDKKEKQTETDADGNVIEIEETEPTTVTAFRALEAMPKNTKLQRKDLHEVQVSSADLPAGAITNADDFLFKYLTANVVAGEYILASKLSDTKAVGPEADGTGNEDYVVVTDYIQLGGDVSTKLQQLIDSNPGRTLYFPDGTYTLAKSITTSADPAKAVSFRLSKFAVIKPSSSYKPTENQGLIRIGATDSDKSGSTTLTGGVIDMGQKGGAAISVEGGRDVLINDFALRSVEIGIHIKTNYVDVDNGSILGAGTDDYGVKTVIGVLVDGSYNTISNLRICSITIGIKLLKSDNVMRNLHPLYTRTNNAESAGFWDESTGNRYDYCYSDNFAIGFHLADGNVSQMNCCFAFWYAASPNRHWGIRQKGRFNSLVTATRIDMCQATEADNAYIWIETKDGGKGAIVDPNTNESGIETGYKSMYTTYKKNS